MSPQKLGLMERQCRCVERKSIKDAGSPRQARSPPASRPRSHTLCFCPIPAVAATPPSSMPRYRYTALCTTPTCVPVPCPAIHALSHRAGGIGRAGRGLRVLRQSWGSRAAPGWAGGKGWERGALGTSPTGRRAGLRSCSAPCQRPAGSAEPFAIPPVNRSPETRSA